MMYLLQIYNYATPYVWFTTAILLIVLVYVLERFRKRYSRDDDSLYDQFHNERENSDSTNLLVECRFPNCVRCSKNLDVLRRARERLSFYFLPADNQVTKNDISNLMEDLKESLHVKSQSGDLRDHKAGYVLQRVTSTPTVFFMRGLRETEFISKEEFPGLDQLEDKYEQIRLEFCHLYQSPLPETKSLWKTNTTDSGKWELAHLVDQGRLTRAGELCPLTMSFLDRLPSFMPVNLFGNAAFSVVYPQTEITTHCGSTNFRIRCHLGLQVPLAACNLQVSKATVDWKEGEVVCFNDAFPHAVYHSGDVNSGMRVVLMIDLWHPDVSKSQRKLLDYVFSPTG